jgi:hypothetical protein
VSVGHEVDSSGGGQDRKVIQDVTQTVHVGLSEQKPCLACSFFYDLGLRLSLFSLCRSLTLPLGPSLASLSLLVPDTLFWSDPHPGIQGDAYLQGHRMGRTIQGQWNSSEGARLFG